MFPPKLTAILTRAEIDLTLERDALEEAPHGAIAARRDSCTWSDGHTWWVVEFNGAEPHGFFEQRLEEFLAWCPAWMVVSTPLRHEDRRLEDGPTQLQPRLSPLPLAHAGPVPPHGSTLRRRGQWSAPPPPPGVTVAD
jgi:hypothetical protein